MYYDKEGNPIDMMTWGKLFEDMEYKRVALTNLENGKVVSTVWLGLDHGFGGKKQIFETMVFPDKDTWGELDCMRYSTLEEAEEGHQEMIRRWEHVDGKSE